VLRLPAHLRVPLPMSAAPAQCGTLHPVNEVTPGARAAPLCSHALLWFRREGAPSNKKSVDEKKPGATAKRGVLSAIGADDVLDLVDSGLPIVGLLTPGDQVGAS